jgi:serine/threonine protein kinase
MSTSEINCLHEQFTSEVDRIERNVYRGSLLRLYEKIKNCVKSATARSLRVKGYYFGNLLSNTYSQTGTTLQHVRFHNRLYCAKIAGKTDMGFEMEMSAALHAHQTCPTVMEVVEWLDLPGQPERAALICPLNPASLCSITPRQCSTETLVNVALCGLAAIAAFRNVGKSHNDIKPANLMLTAASQHVILIDFGSVVVLGTKDISRGTSSFGRDCVPGSAEYDMACLGSTLHYLCYGDIYRNAVIREVVEQMQALSERGLVDAVILDCFRRANDDLHTVYEDWVGRVKAEGESLMQRGIVDFDSVWPTS